MDNNDYIDNNDYADIEAGAEQVDEATADADNTDKAAQPDTFEKVDKEDFTGDHDERLNQFKKRMDAAVEELEAARVAMDEADELLEKQREERNSLVAMVESESNDRIAAVREEEQTKIDAVKAEEDIKVDNADEVSRAATVAYKDAYDAVVRSGLLTRDTLAALGYTKATRRRVARKSK